MIFCKRMIFFCVLVSLASQNVRGGKEPKIVHYSFHDSFLARIGESSESKFTEREDYINSRCNNYGAQRILNDVYRITCYYRLFAIRACADSTFTPNSTAVECSLDDPFWCVELSDDKDQECRKKEKALAESYKWKNKTRQKRLKIEIKAGRKRRKDYCKRVQKKGCRR